MANNTFPAPGPGKGKSYLSSTKYGYDMVVGITEEAINNQLADYLGWYDGPGMIQWFQQKEENSPYEIMKPMDLGGVDIFDIPTGGDIPEALTDESCHFVAAIRAKFGWPADSSTDSPDIINLDRGIKSVSFKMFFSEFQIVKLSWGRRGPIWTNVSQTEEKPLVFEYVVDLNFGSAELGELSPEQQQQLRNLNPSSAWSVQQLYLDLTTASLLKSPEFSSGEAGTIIQNFVHQGGAWERFTEKGRVVLAHTVKKINAQPINAPSMVPTDLKLGISGFLEENGHHNTESPLTTLNYLMMTDQDVMPGQFGGFEWNWVQPNDRSNFNGCMAVKRSKFIRFLNDMLCKKSGDQIRPPINDICLVPDTFISWGKVSIDKCWSKLSPDTNHIVLTEHSSGETVLSLTYQKQHEDTSERFYTAKAVNMLRYTLNFSVKLVANEIRMNIRNEVYSKLKTDLSDFGTSKGIIGGYTLNPVYVIGVNHDGCLHANLKKGTDKPSPIAHTRDEGLFAGIDGTSGTLNDWEGFFDSFVKDSLKGFEGDISSFLKNSGQLFIFPGGKTFSFSSPSFSDQQDLIAELTYVQV